MVLTSGLLLGLRRRYDAIVATLLDVFSLFAIVLLN